MLFFKGQKKKAKDLLSTAYKVYNYRKDLLADVDGREMLAYIDKLEDLIADGKSDSKTYDELERNLEPLMRRCGGKIYPLTAWADYVDMVVVAGIVALGIRSFFLQPFKIPTNSMYPSFYGMTSEVYTDEENAPKPYQKILRRIFNAATNYSLKAESDGDLFIEINNPEYATPRGGLFAFEEVGARDFFIIPTKAHKYSFLQGGKIQNITLPQEFPIDDVILKAFPAPNAATLPEYFKAKYNSGDIVRNADKFYLRLGKFGKNQTMLNFDLLGGDMLFVDRFTYNFRKPKVGEPFVFRTKYCDGLTRLNGGIPDDRYYIKRIAGEGGDTLQVENTTLLRNGKPAAGSPAFEKNAKKEGGYCGYVADGSMSGGAKITVPEKSYWAMGDNSANSLDSRYWGSVPERAVVGKSLIIFYPFSARWGPTK